MDDMKREERVRMQAEGADQCAAAGNGVESWAQASPRNLEKAWAWPPSVARDDLWTCSLSGTGDEARAWFPPEDGEWAWARPLPGGTERHGRRLISELTRRHELGPIQEN